MIPNKRLQARLNAKTIARYDPENASNSHADHGGHHKQPSPRQPHTHAHGKTPLTNTLNADMLQHA
jgi:hypothetical protein